MNFRILFFLAFLGGIALFNGQYDDIDEIEVDSVDHKIHYSADSLLEANPKTNNTISPKTFEQGYQNKYQSKEYDYTSSEPKQSIWDEISQTINNILESIFGKANPNVPYQYLENIIKIIAVVIIGVILYFLIKFLLNKRGNLFFSKKNKNVNIETNEIQENIHEIDFSLSIAHYEKTKDFRWAVRHQFLYVLKQLTDLKLIDWNPEKTNRDYIAEIQNPSLREEFKELVNIFDNVWYGEFDITEKYYWETKNQWKLKINS